MERLAELKKRLEEGCPGLELRPPTLPGMPPANSNPVSPRPSRALDSRDSGLWNDLRN